MLTASDRASVRWAVTVTDSPSFTVSGAVSHTVGTLAGAIFTRTHQSPRLTSAGRSPSSTRTPSYSVSLSATVASVVVPLVSPAAIVMSATVP